MAGQWTEGPNCQGQRIAKAQSLEGLRGSTCSSCEAVTWSRQHTQLNQALGRVKWSDDERSTASGIFPWSCCVDKCRVMTHDFDFLPVKCSKSPNGLPGMCPARSASQRIRRLAEVKLFCGGDFTTWLGGCYELPRHVPSLSLKKRQRTC